MRYPNTWTHWGNEAKFGMSFADREPLRHRYPHGPYSMLGPVQVTADNPGLEPSRRNVLGHDKLVELRVFDTNGIGFSRQYRFVDAARASFSFATTGT